MSLETSAKELEAEANSMLKLTSAEEASLFGKTCEAATANTPKKRLGMARISALKARGSNEQGKIIPRFKSKVTKPTSKDFGIEEINKNGKTGFQKGVCENNC